MCEVEVKFSRYSVKNHLATHGTSIEEYEKRHGAPSDGPSEIIQPSGVQCQSQLEAQPQSHIVATTAQLPPVNTEHTYNNLHSTLLGPSQQIVRPVLYSGDSVHPVPPVPSVPVDLAPLHRADANSGSSIFDFQSETTSESQMCFRAGMNPTVIIKRATVPFILRYSLCEEVTTCTSTICDQQLSSIGPRFALSPHGAFRDRGYFPK